MKAASDQPAPARNDSPAIQDLVIADLRRRRVNKALSRARWTADLEAIAGVADDVEARKQVGLERYGTLLQAHNGRDSLLDAYQEALDLAVYLKQAEVEGHDVSGDYQAAVRLALSLRKAIGARE